MNDTKFKHLGFFSMTTSQNSHEAEMMDVGQSREVSQSDGHVSGSNNIMKSDENKLNESDASARSSNTREQFHSPDKSAEKRKFTPDENRNGSLAVQLSSSATASPNATSKRALSQENPLAGFKQIRMDKDKARLKEAISDISPEAAQQVLREMWRLFLFDGYNKDHISFIIRAGLKNANVAILEKVLKDDGVFKEPFQQVASRKEGIISKVLKNATIFDLFKHLPIALIDEMAEERIKRAPAKDLVKWLAAGNRLGYREDDTLDESDESVLPNIPSQPMIQDQMNFGVPQTQKATYPPILPPPRDAAPPPSYKDPLLIEQEKNRAALDGAEFQAAEARRLQYTSSLSTRYGPPEDLMCKLCNHRLPTMAGYNFHVTKKVCQEKKHTDGRWVCGNCLSGFIGKQGLNYHSLRHVCQKDTPDSTLEQAPAPTPTVNYTSPYEPPEPDQTQKASSGAILPPRPPMHSASSSELRVPAIKMNAAISRNSIGTEAQKPPMHTPKMKQPESTEYRQSPSDLPPEKLAAMNQDLEDEDERYKKKLAEIPNDLTEAERTKRVEGLKNANSTRKSQIRKSYGVSLRLREKDKKAKQAMNSGTDTPPPKGRLEEFRAPAPPKGPVSSQRNGNSTPNVPSFSPVNAPSSGPSSTNGLAFSATQSQYRPPPSNAAQRVFNPGSNHPDTLTHAREGLSSQNANSSGFGMLKLIQTSPMPPMNYQQVQQTNKRRRTSEGTSSPGTGYNSPHFPAAVPSPHSTGLAMVSVEDAAAKYAKRAKPLDSAQRQGPPAAGATPSKNFAVVLPSLAGSGTKESAYTIISSSEDDEIPAAVNINGKRTSASVEEDSSSADADKPLPSVESPISGRMSFRAKRGGKH